ncbi:CHRD domain-containing protein [Subsaximicrobium wynnwilliamsii]|uniref:CHRD domain-containing protein n=1 Tax=Subsaximicrobium wynnwilliamsii TaxID=291179 RepID=UPI00167A235C|nr:CHRD domain-containing protein [Subsaximicrobium wynnwilliamsii]
MLSCLLIAGCENDDNIDVGSGGVAGEPVTYTLKSVSNPDVSGSAQFIPKTDGSTEVRILLSSETTGSHPAHIHMNSAIEGGDIVIDLNPVDGPTRRSVTNITATNGGTAISFEQLTDFDGYINVHESADNLGTLLAQGDIGQNVLTGESKEYALNTKDVDGISGTATFEERVSGETLISLALDGTPDGGMHPAHIHANTALETGGIVINLATVNGTSGMSQINVASLEDGTAITYAELLEFDGYINVHLSADELGTIVAQGDIGQNEIVDTKAYDLKTKDVEGIMGVATFAKRANNTSLITLDVENTLPGEMHPAHIHENSAVETGAIAVGLTPVDGNTGISMTNVAALNDDTEITYDDLLDFDGYINVHLSAAELGTVVAQGDIGANELTGNTKSYVLGSVAVPSINGSALFSERKDGTSLVELNLNGTPDGGMHPAHIHANTAAEGGAIIVDLASVDGSTGMSAIQVEALNDGTEITYTELLDINGYINVHFSAEDLGTLVAQGDIGQNELTGESKTYVLNSVAVPTISGTAKFEERVNDETLVTISISGTPDGGMHPAHIHAGSVAEAPGDILISLTNVMGGTGISKTNVAKFDGDDGAAINYSGLLAIDGYINVHLSAEALGTIVAQGNVGANVD